MSSPIVFLLSLTFAQHEHHHHMDPVATAAMTPGGSGGWYSSGTAQTPRDAPMYMLHASRGAWQFMLSGVLFGVHTNQTGLRGRDKFFAANWVMPMASRRLGPGIVTFRSMLTLEPVTITKKRYPLLLQTGELAYGIPIISGQHPHDFFMELGVAYQLPLGDRTALNFFAGPRGEPAVGPPAFPHRPTASENPTAVLSHHYQDSTHISSSVVTAGITHGPVTIEASGFHGREPDEKRWGLEQGAINSFAARLTVTPTSRWAAQFSAARINNREETHPDRDTLRTTASVNYARPLAAGNLTAAVIWGRNHDIEFTQLPRPIDPLVALGDPKSRRNFHVVTVPTRIPRQIYNSYIAESTLLFRRRNWIWGRVENVDRDTYVLYEEAPFVRLVEEQRYTRVRTYTIGYARELPSPAPWLSTSLGGQTMIYGLPEVLKPIYGDRPLGVQLYLRFRLRSPRQ